MTTTRRVLEICSYMLLCAMLAVPQSARAETYTYDPAGRMTRVTYDDGSSIAYTYDANGNRLQRQVTPAPGATDAGTGSDARQGRDASTTPDAVTARDAAPTTRDAAAARDAATATGTDAEIGPTTGQDAGGGSSKAADGCACAQRSKSVGGAGLLLLLGLASWLRRGGWG